MESFFDGTRDRFEAAFKDARGWISAVLDIVIVAALLYFLFLFLRKHKCTRLIKIIVIALIVGAFLSSSLLGLGVLGNLTSAAFVIITLALALLFPQEMRRTLFRLSSPKTASEVFRTEYDCSDDQLRATIDEIVRAVLSLAKKDIGALIVIAPQEIPYNILESGTKLDAVLTCPLLEAIFNTKAPLHDGAVFVRGNRIVAAGCFLSLTQNGALDKELGTRHRAAIGITETSNVLAIIVSEETGIISVAAGGDLQRYFDSAMLHERLEQVYGLRAFEDKNKKLRRRRK